MVRNFVPPTLRVTTLFRDTGGGVLGAWSVDILTWKSKYHLHLQKKHINTITKKSLDICSINKLKINILYTVTIRYAVNMFMLTTQ